MALIGIKVNNKSKNLIGEKFNAMAKSIGNKALPRSQGKSTRPESSGHVINNNSNTPEVANIPMGLKPSTHSTHNGAGIERSHRGHVTDKFN